MEVRPLKISELNDVLELIDSFDRPSAPRPNDQQLSQIFYFLKQAGGEVIGAFIEGSLVGTCTLNMCLNLSWSGRPFAIIENVIVERSHRKKGIGKAILIFARELAKSKNCYKVALMTGSKRESTLKFYESAGFLGNKTGFEVRFDA
ncbi:MAG: GNAT family N-acetyltransferase [Proteobacteria bacterium]|nr:GNAT family N-acetyltransferase [Pseudomonadota bacterium]